MKKVEIEWVDTNSDHGWVKRKRATNHHIAECSTIGYLLKRNYKEIVVAQSKSGIDDFDHLYAIPMCCVKSIKELK
jgi:hypothetical protein